MSEVKTPILDGTETLVEFTDSHPYYFIKNKGNSDVYVSTSPNIVAKADGVYAISPGCEDRIGDGSNFYAFYILGIGEVQIRGEQTAISPSFRQGSKGGDGSGGGSPGTTDYQLLSNLPTIGGKAVIGSKTLQDYGMPAVATEYTEETAEDTLPTIKVVSDMMASIPTGATSYTGLEDKPSLGGISIEGDKSLSDYGISDFDGAYTSLSGAPVKHNLTERNIEANDITPILRVSSIKQNFETILMVSSNSADAHESFTGVLSVNLYNQSAKFTVISGIGEQGCFPTLEVVYASNHLYVLLYHGYVTAKNLNVQVLYNPMIVDPSAEVLVYPDTVSDYPSVSDRSWSQNITVQLNNPISYNDLRDKPTIDSTLSAVSTNAVQNHIVTTVLSSKLNISDISEWALEETKPTYTAEEVGADPAGSAAEAQLAAEAYADQKVADLVNGAPETLDTLMELAEAYQTNHDVIETLESAITTKAAKTDVETLSANLTALAAEVDTKANASIVVSGIKIGDDPLYQTGELEINKKTLGIYKDIGAFIGTGYGTIGDVTHAIATWCIQAGALTTVARCIVPMIVAESLATPSTYTSEDVIPEDAPLTILYITPVGGYHAVDGSVAKGLYRISTHDYGSEFIRFPLYIVTSNRDEGLNPEYEGYILNEDGSYSIPEEV